jgi:hypothetical protein
MKLQNTFFLNLTIFYFQKTQEITDTKKTEITTEIDKISLENNFNGSIYLQNNKVLYSKNFWLFRYYKKKKIISL